MSFDGLSRFATTRSRSKLEITPRSSFPSSTTRTRCTCCSSILRAISSTVAPGWTVLADLYFTKIGDPPGIDLNNQVAVDAGVSYLLQKGLTVTGLLEGSNALVPGEPSPRDLRGILDYRLDERASVFAGLMVGLSKGSADYGFSLGGSVRF